MPEKEEYFKVAFRLEHVEQMTMCRSIRYGYAYR